MDMVQDIKPISFVKAHAADLIAQVNETHRPLIVTQNGEAKAVLMDPASYQGMQDGIKMLKLIAQSEVEVQKSRRIPQEELFAKLDKHLK